MANSTPKRVHFWQLSYSSLLIMWFLLAAVVFSFAGVIRCLHSAFSLFVFCETILFILLLFILLLFILLLLLMIADYCFMLFFPLEYRSQPKVSFLVFIVVICLHYGGCIAWRIWFLVFADDLLTFSAITNHISQPLCQIFNKSIS